MVECAFLYCMPLGMTLWGMSLARKGGLRFKVLRKFYFLLLVCWQVGFCCYLISCGGKCPFFVEPNDESGANVDAAKMWRENRKEFNDIAEKLVRQTLGIP